MLKIMQERRVRTIKDNVGSNKERKRCGERLYKSVQGVFWRTEKTILLKVIAEKRKTAVFSQAG